MDAPEISNPAEDSIVRSSARQLRNKLQEYFAGIGRDEKLQILVFKGGYVPESVSHGEAGPVEGSGFVAAKTREQRLPLIVLSLLCLALAAACLYLWKSPPAKTLASGPPANLLFSVFHQPERDINLVLCDSALVVVNSLRPKILSLDEYIRFEDQKPVSILPVGPGAFFPGRRLITSFSDVAFAQRLANLWPRSGHVVVRHSRLMQIRDFRSGDFIFLGGPASNPWVGLFEKQFNF